MTQRRHSSGDFLARLKKGHRSEPTGLEGKLVTKLCYNVSLPEDRHSQNLPDAVLLVSRFSQALLAKATCA